MNRRQVTIALAASLCAVAPLPGHAQAFPSKNITIVVPFPAGGLTDQVARVLAHKMGENMKATVVVDNKPGGGSQIAANTVKAAPADGHTLFIGDTGAFAVNHGLYKNYNYDPQKDLVPVSNLVASPLVLVVPKDSPANSVQDLIALSKTKPKGLNYASQGTGTIGHLLAEQFRTKTGININHVPYKGSAPAITDVIGGQVDLLFDPVVTISSHVTGGKVKALAIAAPKRSPALPDVKTLGELGIQGVDAGVWFGLMVKAGTPEPAVKRLNEEVVKALKNPDVAKRFTEQGLEILPTTPAEFGAFLKAESARWAPIVKASGATLD
jgi:tripartite-type tricarboxylate transporter receptor subunit TctC